MELDIIEIAKETFKDKELILEELPNNKVKIWYKNERMYRSIGGTDPRPFVLSKSMELDEGFAEAIGLYLGDGKTTKNDMRHLDFASKDYDIVIFMLNFFTKKFLVNLHNMTITVKHKTGDKNSILEKWSKLLKIPKSKFKISYVSRNRYDTVSIQINSAVLRKMFDEIVHISLPIIKENKLLRIAFLKGYFAAEGTVGYNENENYLNYIGFSYNPKTEKWLRNYCISCLNKENIQSVFRERKGNRSDIIISGWRNYWKLLSIKIFDGCERKKKRFFEIFLSRNIYCNLNEEFRQLLFNSLDMSQREIAKIINSHQGNVCRTIKGKHLLNVNQIKTLIGYTNLSIGNFIENTKAVRVGNGKNILDRNFIETVFKINQETLCS